MSKTSRAFQILITFIALLHFGCGGTELQHGLTEEQANETLVVLQQNGIQAKKVLEKGENPLWTISVPKEDATKSWRIMKQHDLPRPAEKGFSETFGKDSLIPTAVEEKALYLQALCNELQKTIESIDGVVKARVHLVLPEQNVLPEEMTPENRPKAAVLIKYRRTSAGELPYKEDSIRSLVANSIQKLDPKDVVVVGSEVGTGLMQSLAGGGITTPALKFVAFGPVKIANDSVFHFKAFGIGILTTVALLAIGMIMMARKSSSLVGELNKVKQARSVAKVQA